MSDDLPPPDVPLVAVARYASFSKAQEAGLVALAVDRPYWVVKEGMEFVLYVEEIAGRRVAEELERFNLESKERSASIAATPPVEKLPVLALFLMAWLMASAWFVQRLLPAEWVERGVSSSGLVMKGEWWRAVTALMLHGDGPHLVANLATGLLFAAFVLPQMGSGMGILAIVATGLFGNVMNAFFYRNEEHHSIGASTAVFGALGLLVAAELVARASSPHTRSRWQLIVPIGAGLALLAFLGAGSPTGHTDYMAHLWGFLAGLAIGAVAAVLRLKERVPVWGQRAAGISAVATLALAWFLALR